MALIGRKTGVGDPHRLTAEALVDLIREHGGDLDASDMRLLKKAESTIRAKIGKRDHERKQLEDSIREGAVRAEDAPGILFKIIWDDHIVTARLDPVEGYVDFVDPIDCIARRVDAHEASHLMVKAAIAGAMERAAEGAEGG